jgi:hypothetical protein
MAADWRSSSSNERHCRGRSVQSQHTGGGAVRMVWPCGQIRPGSGVRGCCILVSPPLPARTCASVSCFILSRHAAAGQQSTNPGPLCAVVVVVTGLCGKRCRACLLACPASCSQLCSCCAKRWSFRSSRRGGLVPRGEAGRPPSTAGCRTSLWTSWYLSQVGACCQGVGRGGGQVGGGGGGEVRGVLISEAEGVVYSLSAPTNGWMSD